MVSVNLILRDNLITKAQGAKEEYELAAQKESNNLDEFETALNDVFSTGNTENSTSSEEKWGYIDADGIMLFYIGKSENYKFTNDTVKAKKYEYNLETENYEETEEYTDINISECRSVFMYDPLTITGPKNLDFNGISLENTENIEVGPFVETVKGLEGFAEIPNGFCQDAENLKEVILNTNIKSIGEFAFSNCTNLTKIDLPNSIESIDNNAFEYCSKLEKIILPNTLKQISAGTFQYCDSLTNVEIPNTVTEIGGSAFRDCYALTNMSIPEGVKFISEGLFLNCYNLEKVHMPDTVTVIKYYAFTGCTKLKDINISNNTKSIGEYVFRDCTSLEKLDLPASLEGMWTDSLLNCTSLTDITIRKEKDSLSLTNTGLTSEQINNIKWKP